MAGKGPNPRPVVFEKFQANHDFIYGVTPSYSKCRCGEECQLRGEDKGKCWGQVTQYDEDEHSGGNHLCEGHCDHYAFEAVPYIPEPQPARP